MDYQVILAPSARVDLRGIMRYISLDNPARSMSFGRLLVTSTKRLGEHPEIGRMVPEYKIRALREIIVRPYRVIYRVDHSRRLVEVARFWHSARGLPILDDPT